MEKPSYPIVTEHLLAPVPRKRFRTRGSAGRTPDEVPQPLASQRLVYFTRGEYVLDTSSFPLDSSTVIDASRVSVVDVKTDTSVMVLLTIPSQDATSFTMRVTFLCTVEDPVTVVRMGGHDAESMLAGYLRAHHRLFEVGLDYTLSDINQVRRKLSAQVRAYVAVVPPEFAGMTATLASVEVLTPDELTRFQESLRGERQKHTVELERQRHEKDRLDQKLRYEQDRRDQELYYEREREAVGKRHTRELDAEQRDFEREQLRHTTSAVAADPVAALVLSHAAGEITAKELADELKELREREAAQQREDLLARIEFEREREKADWEAERLDQARRLEWDHEKVMSQQKAELRTQVWEREDRRLDREERLKQLEAKLEVVRELGKHGHLDTANLRLDQILNDVLGDSAVTSVEGGVNGDRAQLESRQDDGDEDLIDDEKVRVEDAH